MSTPGLSAYQAAKWAVGGFLAGPGQGGRAARDPGQHPRAWWHEHRLGRIVDDRPPDQRAVPGHRWVPWRRCTMPRPSLRATRRRSHRWCCRSRRWPSRRYDCCSGRRRTATPPRWRGNNSPRTSAGAGSPSPPPTTTRPTNSSTRWQRPGGDSAAEQPAREVALDLVECENSLLLSMVSALADGHRVDQSRVSKSTVIHRTGCRSRPGGGSGGRWRRRRRTRRSSSCAAAARGRGPWARGRRCGTAAGPRPSPVRACGPVVARITVRFLHHALGVGSLVLGVGVEQESQHRTGKPCGRGLDHVRTCTRSFGAWSKYVRSVPEVLRVRGARSKSVRLAMPSSSENSVPPNSNRYSMSTVRLE